MIRIAITGSIGMGKSTVAAMFAEAGIPLFDADAEVRAMQAFGGKLVDAIEIRFPGTTRAGAVDRDLLAARVLGDRDQLAALEMIVHPAVVDRREAFITDHRDAPVHPGLKTMEKYASTMSSLTLQLFRLIIIPYNMKRC